MVSCLAVVDTEAVDKHKRLGKAAAAQDDVGLCSTRPALLDKCGRVIPEEVERSLNCEQIRFYRKYFNRTG